MRHSLPSLAVAALVASLAPAPLLARQGSAPAAARTDAPEIRVLPARPVPGALVRVVVRAAADTLQGALAGEPLHFTREKDGRWLALGAVPIDSAGRVNLSVDVVRAGATTDVVTRALALDPPPYRHERLRVAPEFGREPDSALAARLEQEAARALAVSRAAHETPRLWTTPFAAPRPGRVTSGFGTAREFNGAVKSRHMGTDFAGAEGAPIRAVNRGVVRLVARFYLGGNVVYVDHGAGLVTAYLHLSRTEVAEGDTVSRGQTIGRVGSTGRVTGPHLHFIVRYGTITADPMTLLRPLGAAAPKKARRR